MSESHNRLSLADAQQRIAAICATRRLPSESIDLSRALGRTLAVDVCASRDQPFFTNSAMDGFALRGEDLPQSGSRDFRLIGTRLAGDQTQIVLGQGECVRITTGAALPLSADTVVIKEHALVEGSTVHIACGESPGSHVRPAGEDYSAGDALIRAGQRIGAAHVAALAAAGFDRVNVASRPKVRIMTTGDELVMPGSACGTAQIYNSNGYALAAMLRKEHIDPDQAHGARQDSDFIHLRDDPESIRAALVEAARSADVIITSGGVSAGEADYLPGLVADLGTIHFWKVRMRPGMPFLFGEIGRSLIFCLPGNPVSTIATFLCLVRPALSILQGRGDATPQLLPARLTQPISKRHDRTEFLRAVCEVRNDASLWVTPVAQQGSAMLRGLVEANALIMVPEQTTDLAVADIVQTLSLLEFR